MKTTAPTAETTQKTTPEMQLFLGEPREPRLTDAPRVRVRAACGRAHVRTYESGPFWRGSRGFPRPYSLFAVVFGVVLAWLEAWLTEKAGVTA